MRRSLLLPLILLAASLAVFSQNPDDGTRNSVLGTPYSRSTNTNPYVPLTVGGGATQLFTGPGTGDFSTNAGVPNGDDGTAYIPLPFPFTINGTAYTAGTNYLGICTNGFVYFSTTNTNASKITTPVNTNLFTSAIPLNIVAPWWDDETLNPVNGSAPKILFQVTGVLGNQDLVVEFQDYPSYNSGNAERLNFEVRFNQLTMRTEFWYGGHLPGTIAGGNPLESASSGFKNTIGGANNFLDAITGSNLVSNSMLNSRRFPSRNIIFLPGLPTPLVAGTYNVGAGGNFPNLSEAIATLNNAGTNGNIDFLLTDPVYDETPGGGNNIFPLLIGSFPRTIPNSTVTIRAPTMAQLFSMGTTSGSLGNEDSPTAIGTGNEPLVGLFGADNIYMRYINFLANSGSAIDVGVLLTNGSGTNGAINNIIESSEFRMMQDPFTAFIEVLESTPITGPLGANSNNIFQDLFGRTAYCGIFLNGNSTNPDISNFIRRCQLGEPLIPLIPPTGAIGNGGSFNSFIINATNQRNISIINNAIRNATISGAPFNGIILSNVTGTSNQISGNNITGLRALSTSSVAPINGMNINLSPTGSNSVDIFNNFISNITSAYSGAATATRQIAGITLGGGTSNSYNLYFNSALIDGSGSPNVSNTCVDVPTPNIPWIHRFNSWGNSTGAQAGVAKHSCVHVASANSIGAATSNSNYNNYFIANATNGPVGIGNTTDYFTLPAWTAGMTGNPGTDVNSISADPLYISPTDLHISGLSPNINNALNGSPVTNDIDGQLRPAGVNPDIGADEYYSLLPVSLVYFSGEKQSPGNLLRWTTVAESNNKGFEVQRFEGVDYKAIGFVNSMAAGGNSGSELNYSFLDTRISGNRQLYRLRQVDLDNHSRYSNIVLIKSELHSAITIGSVFPNPAREQVSLMVETPVRDQFRLVVTDVGGKIIKEETVKTEKGSNNICLDIRKIPAGLYLIKLVNEKDDVIPAARFIKQ